MPELPPSTAQTSYGYKLTDRFGAASNQGVPVTIHEADFRGTDTLLETLDALRAKIESGEVIGFALVGIMAGGAIWQQHDCFIGQKPALIGGLVMKANLLSAEYTADQMNVALSQ